MELTYSELFLVDLMVCLTCLMLMLHARILSMLHPASLYLFFHAYTFTFRLFQLANGAPTMFQDWPAPYVAVTRAEIQRAAHLAEGALITITVLCILLAARRPSRSRRSPSQPLYRPFLGRLMWLVLSVTLPVGFVALVALRVAPLMGMQSLQLGPWSASSYLISAYQWFGISLLALCYYYGPRLAIMAPLLGYLVLALVSFPFRMMTIIPLLFVVLALLRRANRRWPSRRQIAALAAAALIFVGGKGLGPILREGNIAGAARLLPQQVVSMLSGRHYDTVFLDEMAVALTQIDEAGHFYFGGTYVGLLTLPVPRTIWPAKPGVADWQKQIQTPGRPMGQIGAIATLLGEAYANFGYPGVFFYSAVLAILLDRLYHWMSQAPYYSLANFWSLCVYAILIQVFRDGFVSLVIMQATIFMPLTAITLIHLFVARRRRFIRVAAGCPAVQRLSEVTQTREEAIRGRKCLA